MRTLTFIVLALGMTGCLGGSGGDRPFPVPGDADGGVERDEGTGDCRPPTAHETWSYGYDDRGRMATANAITFGYDGADRLLKIENPATLARFERDGAGDWTSFLGVKWTAQVTTRSANTLEVAYEGDPTTALGVGAPAFDASAYPDLAVAKPTLGLLEQATLVDAAPVADTDPVQVEFTMTHTYDDEGQLTASAARALDDAPLFTTTIEREDDVTTTRVEYFGVLASVFVYATYGDPTAPDRTTVDQGGDGVIDSETTWTRGPGFEEAVLDNDADGRPDQRTRIEFNPAGQRVLKTEDEGADGTIDWRKRYVYDANGLRIWEARDSDVNGLIDERWDYTYDDARRLVREVRTDPRVDECGVNWE